MDRKRWQQLQRLFEEALGLPAELRSSLLEECSDSELRREVEAMLAAADRGEPFTSVIGEELRDVAIRLAGSPTSGQRVGPYRLLRELGRGGMGVVFEAERADGEFEQRVALKLVRGPVLMSGRLERFQAERQILATLEHPNIARLLDGGTTDDGTPYLAMEYVEGEPVDEYCDRLGLTIEERLLLFRRICNAVESAHRQLVVHRDLKPSNILVAANGEPKLLDFGVAKLIERGAEESREGLTVTGEQIMTPEYASPEQVRAEPVSTATDVYALGLLLYEMLTGRRAQHLSSTDRGEVERVICETPPTRPSSRVTTETSAFDSEGEPETLAVRRGTSPAKLERRLAGDLDTIVLTALRKEPERRYASVTQLSEDVRRHLEGWPILARADSWSYRAGKFVRRHRTGIAAVLIAGLSLIGASIASTWGLLRARAAEEDALQQAEAAEEIAGFLERLFAVSDPSEARGRNVTALEVLERGVERIEAELSDQPVVQGRLLTTMARVHAGLGLIDDASDLFARAYDILRAAIGESHPDTLLAVGSLGNAYVQLGRFGEAESHLRQAYEGSRQRLGESHPDTLRYLGNLAVTLWRQGRIEPAMELGRRTLELRREVLGPDHLHTLVAGAVLSSTLTEAGRLAEAEVVAREALGGMTRQFGRDHPQTLHVLNNLATIYGRLGRYYDEEALLDEALDLSRTILGEENPSTLVTRGNRSLLLNRIGRHQEAEQEARAVLAAQIETLGEGHHLTLWTRRNLALIYRDSGRPEEAERQLREAHDGRRRELGPEHPETLQSAHDLAALQVMLGHPQKAEVLLREALEGWRTHGENHPSTLQAMSELGDVLSMQGYTPEAEQLLEPAVQRLRESYPGRQLLLSQCLTRLAQHRMRSYELAAAEPLLTEALDLVEPLHPVTHSAAKAALEELRRSPS